MVLSSTFVVHVDKPAEILLSTYFAEMRIWLDAHEIAPTDFRLFGGYIVGLEVRFRSPEQATLFEQEFGPKEQPANVARLIFPDHSAPQAYDRDHGAGSDQRMSDDYPRRRRVRGERGEAVKKEEPRWRRRDPSFF